MQRALAAKSCNANSYQIDGSSPKARRLRGAFQRDTGAGSFAVVGAQAFTAPTGLRRKSNCCALLMSRAAMAFETILLPDHYPLKGLRSLSSLRLDILGRPPGYLDILRQRFADGPQKLWTTTEMFDPLTDIFARACCGGNIRLIVGNASNANGHAISQYAFRGANPLFDKTMSLSTCTFCVWPHLAGITSLEQLNSGQPIWVSEADASALYKRGHPSAEDISVIGKLIIDEYRLRDIRPILTDLWDEISARVEALCGGRPSIANVKAIVDPSVPATWHKCGPKRGCGSQAMTK